MQNYFLKEKQWRADVWRFVNLLRKHWTSWIAQITGGGIYALWSGGGGVIPGWAISAIAGSGFVIAAFRVWQDQCRISEAASARVAVLEMELSAIKTPKTLEQEKHALHLRVVELQQNGVHCMDSLIKAGATKLHNNEELLEVIERLKKHGCGTLQEIEYWGGKERWMELLKKAELSGHSFADADKTTQFLSDFFFPTPQQIQNAIYKMP